MSFFTGGEERNRWKLKFKNQKEAVGTQELTKKQNNPPPNNA